MVNLNIDIVTPTGKSLPEIANELATQIVAAGRLAVFKQEMTDQDGTLCYIAGHVVIPISNREIEGLVVDHLRAIQKATPTAFNHVTRLVRVMAPLRKWDDVNHPKHWQYISFKNGVLKVPDLTEKTPPEWNPALPADYLTTVVIPWDYEPDNQETSNFNFFMDYFTGGDTAMRARILEMMGYFLIPTNPFKKAWLIHGTRDTGKTTLLEILKEALGRRNAAEVSIKDVCEGLGEAGHVTSLVEGKLLVYKNEVGGTLHEKHLNIFKDVTGGKRDFTVNQKYQDMRNARVTFKIAAATNDLPTIKFEDGVEVFIQRWVVELANNQWNGGPNTIVESIVADELPGVLNLMVQGLLALLQRGTLESNADALALWIREIDPFRAFFEETYTKDRNGVVPLDDLTTAWQLWADENDVTTPIEKGVITRRLGSMGIGKARRGQKGKQYWVYTGIKESPPNHPEDPFAAPFAGQEEGEPIGTINTFDVKFDDDE